VKIAGLMYPQMPHFAFFLLQQAAPNPLVSFLPLVFIVAIFYFLVFMPMQRQKKQQAQMLASLQSGSEVVTSGGIVGTVVSVADNVLVVRVKPDNIKLQISRSAVTSIVNADKAIEEKK